MLREGHHLNRRVQGKFDSGVLGDFPAFSGALPVVRLLRRVAR